MQDIDELPRFMEHRLNIWKGYFGIEDTDLKFRVTVDHSLDDEMARMEYKDGFTTLYLNLFLMASDDEELDRMAFNIVFQALLTVLASLGVLTYTVENIQTENPDAEIPERFLDAGRRERALADRLAYFATLCIWPVAGVRLCAQKGEK